ncbi:TetR family transcriptional regulator [Cellulomonas massiliensis]|uniref:TetR family transcriptional regulator n=1 Tax=Cellulomonas massiliensis TaxID=1465811 RepID=UPI000301FB91|nr:TetR family transcriptional regulator [Cellulomonas massiliensis]
MVRWEPGARDRLVAAALDLYAERGFEQTTVDDIAERAGVTQRTFFRHFTDKREVLFDGSSELLAVLERTIAELPDVASPAGAAAEAFAQAAAALDERPPGFPRRRAAVIAQNAALQERELLKLATMSAAVRDALGRRGVEPAVADLAAELGTTAFRVGFQQWIDDERPGSLVPLVRGAFAALRSVAAS